MEINSHQHPLAHAANAKEYYENMELLLEKTQYEKHNWSICGDLKSLQFSCLACSLATQRFVTFCVSGIVTDRKHHYIEKQWPKKE